jgi:hypothetical protein
MNRLDSYLLANVPAVVNLQRLESKTIEHRVSAAIERVRLASLDHYDNILVESMYWGSDNTGSKQDSHLFLQTIVKLGNAETNVVTQERVLDDGEKVSPLVQSMVEVIELMAAGRRLFILHYAGHAVSTSTTCKLAITSRISKNEVNGSSLNLNLIKDHLKDLASTSEGLDILILLDCCCASAAGCGGGEYGERVELMAATLINGISNSRADGKTFTQFWCDAFNKFLAGGKAFNCTDINDAINSDPDLEQFPATFVVREGSGVPITFRASPSSVSFITPVATRAQTVITALHIAEDPSSPSMTHLVEFLKTAPVHITILAILPVSSSLLLLEVPAFLQETLMLLRISILADSDF